MEMINECGAMTKITDVNMDCLEKVFNYLYPSDLANVADSNSYLRGVAQLVYRLQYGATEVFIADVKCTAMRLVEYHDGGDGCIWIADLKTSLVFLRNFGHAISKLIISKPPERSMKNTFPAERYDICYGHLITYANQFGSDSLIDISFRGPFSTGLEFNKALKKMEKPFVKAKSLEMTYGCHFNPHFYRLFTNLENLTYEVSKYEQIDDIKQEHSRIKREVNPPTLAKAFPKLAEIDFSQWTFIIKDPTEFITAIKSLKQISFRMKKAYHRNLEARLCAGWCAKDNRKYGTDYITIQRVTEKHKS